MRYFFPAEGGVDGEESVGADPRKSSISMMSESAGPAVFETVPGAFRGVAVAGFAGAVGIGAGAGAFDAGDGAGAGDGAFGDGAFGDGAAAGRG